MATCADCVHVEVCSEYVEGLAAARGLKLGSVEEISAILQCDDCEHFKDRARFVELPCAVGDTVYVIENIAGEEKIIQDSVETMGIGYYADGVELYQFDGIKTDGYFSDFGKTVFLTREEAEQALMKKREANGQSQN